MLGWSNAVVILFHHCGDQQVQHLNGSLRAATSPTATDREESPSTAASLRTRTSTCGTRAPGSCPWPTGGGTQTARSSSSPWRRRSTWTSSTWPSAACRRAWRWCSRWERWAPRQANQPRGSSSRTAERVSVAHRSQWPRGAGGVRYSAVPVRFGSVWRLADEDRLGQSPAPSPTRRNTFSSCSRRSMLEICSEKAKVECRSSLFTCQLHHVFILFIQLFTDCF